MADAHDVTAYKDVMLVLATAAVAVPLLQRLKISPVLGYLIAGILLGPQLLGGFGASMPGLRWVTVSDPENLATLGELGVTFLLFIIGLELAPQRLWTMRRLVFGLGSLQILLSAAALGLIASWLGQSPQAALILGSSLALSSTAIVVELLSQQNRLSLGTGRASFAILLMQDLAVIPLLMLVPILGTGSGGSIFAGVAVALAQAMVAVGIIVAVGYVVLRPLFRLVASTESADLFVAAVLLVAVGSGVATAAAGLSMTLGAFIAGLLLAETEYRKAIESTIEPVKGLLLGAFFFTVGAGLDLNAVFDNPGAIVIGVAVLLSVKGVIVAGLVRAFAFTPLVAGRTAALIAPGGEFAFIVLGLAATGGILDAKTVTFALAVTSVSMALIPVLDVLAQRILPVPQAPPLDPELKALPAEDDDVTAIVIGHGRVGELVSSMLDVHGIRHVVTEKRPDIVSDARKSNRPVFYGDARNANFLLHCGLSRAKAAIVTIHDWDATDEIVKAIVKTRPGMVVVARTRDAEHAKRLYELGVTDAVPETIEASLQLSEAALVDLGVPTGLVIASIHQKRDEFRHALQTAAGKSGRTEIHGLRAKSKKPTVAS